MAPPNKLSAGSTARRKSSPSKSKVITLKLSPEKLSKFAHALFKEESPSKDSSSTISNPPVAAAAASNADNPPESASNTPAASGTPIPSSMPPPPEIIKKKGVKRSSTVALGPDGLPIPKVRGKPGPKKRPRLEDGTIDHSNTTPRATGTGTAAHKLGPKANQGAINAGLRALDRSGKQCRKWQKGSFKLKSFTGVAWEIPRWKAPPKIKVEADSTGSASGDSSKENKDNSQIASEKSNGVPDIEMTSAASQNPVSSPAPSGPPAPPPTSSAPRAPSDAPAVPTALESNVEPKVQAEVEPEAQDIKQENVSTSVAVPA